MNRYSRVPVKGEGQPVFRSSHSLEGRGIVTGRFPSGPERFILLSAGAPQAPNGTLTGKKTMGFMLAHEQFSMPKLVEFGELAEQAGFDLRATSDHFQPWQDNEDHAGEAWVTMSALGQRTKKVWIGPTVTCPTFRYKPLRWSPKRLRHCVSFPLDGFFLE